jgi:hypothetical protein
MMHTCEPLKSFRIEEERLTQGASVRNKYTGQIVLLKGVSEYGVSIIICHAGGEKFISNKFLEPVTITH